MSGLIDASGIPENERQNIQQSKKSRRGSRNKDEVEAFHYTKSFLAAMLQVWNPCVVYFLCSFSYYFVCYLRLYSLLLLFSPLVVESVMM